VLDPEVLRAFVSRPWAEIEERKRAALAERYRADPDAHVERVWALAEHLGELRRERGLEGQIAAERAADLEAHVAMRRAFERAAEALRSRPR
jgi:hypothetical protein